MMMHAARYFYCAVDGLCIGTSSPEDGSIAILDVVPLFHNGTLAPMLEAAAYMAEKYAKAVAGDEGLVVGYYYGNEHAKDESLPNQAATIGSTIAAAVAASAPGKRACVVQVASARLSDPADAALVAYETNGSGSWTRADADVSIDPAASNWFLSALDDDVPIVDFDLHLDDVRHDWRNDQVRCRVERPRDGRENAPQVKAWVARRTKK